MNNSKLDPIQMQRMAFDEESKATRVKLQDTQMSVELSHEDGDSVESHPAKLTVSVIGCSVNDNGKNVTPGLNCSSLREVRVDVDGTGSVMILVSPTDQGDFFYEVGGAGEVHKICARRIVIKCIDVVGDIHLVGRS